MGTTYEDKMKEAREQLRTALVALERCALAMAPATLADVAKRAEKIQAGIDWGIEQAQVIDIKLPNETVVITPGTGYYDGEYFVIAVDKQSAETIAALMHRGSIPITYKGAAAMRGAYEAYPDAIKDRYRPWRVWLLRDMHGPYIDFRAELIPAPAVYR